jgi:sulfur-oxidizing protein SoxZ
MSEASRIRAQVQGNGALVRVRMSHEMESGQRKDGSGRTLPAWHITEVAVALNGRTVMTAMWGTAVAKNPFTEFIVKGAKAGDRIAVSWLDNRGDRRTDETTVV